MFLRRSARALSKPSFPNLRLPRRFLHLFRDAKDAHVPARRGGCVVPVRRGMSIWWIDLTHGRSKRLRIITVSKDPLWTERDGCGGTLAESIRVPKMAMEACDGRGACMGKWIRTYPLRGCSRWKRSHRLLPSSTGGACESHVVARAEHGGSMHVGNDPGIHRSICDFLVVGVGPEGKRLGTHSTAAQECTHAKLVPHIHRAPSCHAPRLPLPNTTVDASLPFRNVRVGPMALPPVPSDG